MPKRIYDDDYNPDGVLRDGESLRVSMFAMDTAWRGKPVGDAMPHELKTDAMLVDAFGDASVAAMSRPGARFLRAGSHTVDHAHLVTANLMRAEAYHDGVQQMCDAWKSTTNDREVPRIHDTGDPVADAYADFVHDLENAWHRGSGRR